MLVLSAIRVSKSGFSDHAWVEDLLFFDGPLLTLMKASTVEDYFYYFVDSSLTRNRWMALPVSRSEISLFKAKEISLQQIFDRQDHIYFVDRNKEDIERVFKVEKDNVPGSYVPPKTSYFDETLTHPDAGEVLQETGSYELQVDGEWFLDDLSKIPKLYRQLYSLFYSLARLEKRSIRRNFESAVRRYPWRGGYSVYNTFQDLIRHIPSYHEPKIRKMEYASPGVLVMDLLLPVAKDLERCIHSSRKNLVPLDIAVSNARKYLSRNKLNRLEEGVQRVALRPATQRALEAHVNDISGLMGLNQHVARLREMAPNALLVLKLLLSIHRKFSDLGMFENRDLIRL